MYKYIKLQPRDEEREISKPTFLVILEAFPPLGAGRLLFYIARPLAYCSERKLKP